jgi:hypothetical protein
MNFARGFTIHHLNCPQDRPDIHAGQDFHAESSLDASKLDEKKNGQ